MKYVRLIRLSIHERVIIDPLMPYFFFTSTCPFFTSYLMSDLFFLRVSSNAGKRIEASSCIRFP